MPTRKHRAGRSLTDTEEVVDMKYDQFITEVIDQGGPQDRATAETATTVVLEDLGKRLKGNEPQNLADQLPSQLRELLSSHTEVSPTNDDVDAFLRRIAEHEGSGVSPDDALAHARAVFGALSLAVSPGEIDDLRSQLPAGFTPLFP